MPNWLRLWVLDSDNKPVRARDVIEWGQFLELRDRCTVGYTQINSRVYVSTVFLGIDHRHFGSGPPILFETMIFGGELDGHQWRYSSWDDAETGHQAVVRKMREAAGQKVKSDGCC